MKKITFIVLSIFISSNGFASDLMLKEYKDIIKIVSRHNMNQIDVAINILNTVYESGFRPIKSTNQENKYGAAFTCNPEMLCNLMEQAGGKRFLEIGGASGENSILIGLSGAKHVYMNDIALLEIETFKAHVAKLNPRLHDKFTPIHDDCFNLGKHITAHSLDIILVRNFFHFLMKSRYKEFFNIIKGLLKPNGVLAMTVNSHYCYVPKILNLHAIRYTTYTLFCDINHKQKIFMRESYICDEDKDPLDFKNYYCFINGNIKESELKKVPKNFQFIIKKQEKKLHHDFNIKHLISKNIILRVLKTTSMLFTPETLTSIVENHGLKMTSTAHIGTKGHYLPDVQATNFGAQSVALIAKMPEDTEDKSEGDDT